MILFVGELLLGREGWRPRYCSVAIEFRYGVNSRFLRFSIDVYDAL